MADFRTHVTTSSILGVGYAGAGMLYGLPYQSCILSGVVCGVAGMMPDLDSGSGRPLRESTAFLAAVVPMLLVDRFRKMGLSPESMVLAGSMIYFLIRFGLYRFLRFYTVHRGMFHSLPAMIIFGQLGFLLSSDSDLRIRVYKACAVMLGYLSHLLLDEFYSFELHAGGWVRIKKSFGTAVKLYGDKMWANVSTYSKLAFLTFVLLEDPMLWESIERLGLRDNLPLAEESQTEGGANPSATLPDSHVAEIPSEEPAPPRTVRVPRERSADVSPQHEPPPHESAQGELVPVRRATTPRPDDVPVEAGTPQSRDGGLVPVRRRSPPATPQAANRESTVR